MDDITTNRGHGEKLSRLGPRALACLMVHETIAEAAAAVPVNEKTLRRWLKLPAFKRRLREMTQATVDHAIAALNESSSEAARVMRKSMASKTPAIALRAATEVLRMVTGRQDHEEMQRKLLEIEERLSNAHGQGGNGKTN